MERLSFILIIWFSLLSPSVYPRISGADDRRVLEDYVLEKCRTHDLVFLGTTHRQPAILFLIGHLLPELTGVGVTHLGLEIGSDQQERIDAFLSGQGNLSSIGLANAIDCPEYRRLFQVLRNLPMGQRTIVRAIDLPTGLYSQGISRDQWMAKQLNRMVRDNEDANILTIAGSLHVLRRLEWLPGVQSPTPSIRSLLSQWQPDLTMFSIVNIVGDDGPGRGASDTLAWPSGTVAMDVDQRFKGWRLGVIKFAALAPAEPWTLIDGIILHQPIEASKWKTR